MKAARPAEDFPAISERTRLLVVAPHPDDETIATGILIQQVRAAGGEVKIVLLTGGDNNPWPQRWLERRLWIGASARRRWGQRRHAEILQALASLDLSEQALHPMGWPDMGVTDALLSRAAQAVASVAEVIEVFQPNLVAMPSLNDRHPDHGSAHVLLRLALAGRPVQPPWLAYLVHGKAAPEVMRVMPGSVDQAERKREALEAHRSQMALSGKRMRRFAARPECFEVGASTSTRSSAALPWKPSAWLRPWLRLSVVGPQGAHTWSWRDAPLRRDEAGGFYLCCGSEFVATPCFARLAVSFPTLWIFDRWGWCELLPPFAGA